MLSRVAAVKAPRTDNRRRVTGSSGMRREGGESEPQRPNMSRHHFYSAVLLLLMLCGSGEAAADGDSKSNQGASSGKHYVWRDVKDEEEKLSLLRVPSLVEMDGEVFAVAEAHCTKEGESDFTGIASELLEWTGEQEKEELDRTKLKTQVLEECSSGDKGVCSIANQAVSQGVKNVHVSRPTTVVKGSDIYMIAGNYSWTLKAGDQDSGAAGWGLMLVKGNVSTVDSKKRILWNDTYVIPWNYKGNQNEPLKRLIGSGGSGLKMEDGTLVFPLEGTKKKEADAEEDGKTVSLVIYSTGNEGWKLPKGMSADGCGVPSVVEWEKDKLMMMTACDGGRRRVYESGDKGESWTEALGTLSRVWGNTKGEKAELVGSGFTTATIDKKKVMLVTLPVYSKEKEKEEKEKGSLHLWLTDNTHIVDIGPVSDDDVAASSLLYKSGESGNDNNGEKLIALYEKKESGDEDASLGMASVLLTVQLEKVKEVLKTWKNVDERVSQLCTSEKVTSSETACSADIKITDGLVGFLSGNFSENTWRDEYLGVNATVHKGTEVTEATGATKTSDGVTFQGAWAEWPVGSQGQNQLYHFANYNFTLVATVSIDGEPKGNTPIPLLGVRAGSNGGKKLFGLSYNGGDKWQLLCGDETNKEISSTWKRGTKHQVAIVLRNGSDVSAYVDGKRLGKDAQCELKNTDSEGISHFYIGGDGGSADNTRSREVVSVTVTNVLLYNRPLTFSGGNAEVEEVTDSPSAEPASPFVARNQNAAPPATIPPEAPVGQTTLQQPQHEGKGQNATAEESATTQEVPATTSQGSVGKAAASNSHAAGEARDDAGIMRESGLPPSLLLLLGLWGFAAL
ncbi:putative trans-sialidase, Group V [Trypanosoma cruzi]|uniref:Putative trans-sialidase, Group V n=1 Tax=Trypanosoma cruzi TaxID=5693 RepID=A0A2V2WCS7_TRYCR|nr:putative trans-sialidase, Group V [Trypanosoma cruzi]